MTTTTNPHREGGGGEDKEEGDSADKEEGDSADKEEGDSADKEEGDSAVHWLAQPAPVGAASMEAAMDDFAVS